MNRLLIALTTALWGGATMLTMTTLPGLDAGIALPAALFAGLAGALLAPVFGRKGPFWAVSMPLLATVIGAAGAGAAVGYPQDIALGLVFGPLMVGAACVENPMVLVVWLCGAAALRHLARQLAPS